MRRNPYAGLGADRFARAMPPPETDAERTAREAREAHAATVDGYWATLGPKARDAYRTRCFATDLSAAEIAYQERPRP